jgi:chromosome partitioning protein
MPRKRAKAIKLVRAQERVFKRTIRYTILFTRTSVAIKTRTLQSIESEFAARKIPMLKTDLNERDAYRALFAFGGTLVRCCSNPGLQYRRRDS